MRVTRKYLIGWLQDKFKELELDLEVVDIHKTHLRSDEYEGGAAHWIFTIKIPTSGLIFPILMFYPLSILQEELNNGYELFLDTRRGRGYLPDSEVNVRKK